MRKRMKEKRSPKMTKYKFVKDDKDGDMVKIYIQDILCRWFLAGVFHIDMIIDMLSEDKLNVLEKEKQINLIGEFKEVNDK